MTGVQGSTGAQGVQGSQGFQGAKAAIVAYLPAGAQGPPSYITLACVEMPEVRFEDLMTVQMTGLVETVRLDPRFFAVCKEGSIDAISAIAEIPAAIGARIEGSELRVETDRLVARVIVRLSGLRLGSDWRFLERTAAQAERNNSFWSSVGGD